MPIAAARPQIDVARFLIISSQSLAKDMDGGVVNIVLPHKSALAIVYGDRLSSPSFAQQNRFYADFGALSEFR